VYPKSVAVFPKCVAVYSKCVALNPKCVAVNPTKAFVGSAILHTLISLYGVYVWCV